MVTAAPWRARASAYALAACAVLPLVTPVVWSGWRLGLADPVLAVLASSEQPLSVRSLVGLWVFGLNLAWCVLACRARPVAAWQVMLVVVGGAVALARVGNAWFDGLALLAPLAQQLGRVAGHRLLVGIGGAACLALSGLTSLAAGPPPALPDSARQAARAADGGHVFADWRWADDVQRLAPDRTVYPLGGLASEPAEFWLDYVRASQGHVRWLAILDGLQADLLVLDAADQQTELARLVRGAPEWQVLVDDGRALVAARRRP